MKKTLMVFIVLGLLCSYNISFGDIFKYTDNDGVIHLTNVYDSEPCKTYGCILVRGEKPISPSTKSSSDWVEYGRTEDGDSWLYNDKNITKSRGKNIVQVWVKWILSDKQREERIRRIRKVGLSTEEWGKLSQEVSLLQIDCKNKKCQILSMTDYDTDGNVLNTGNVDKPEWIYIVPSSYWDILRKKVCK